jgi:hypothetical protein
MRIKLLGLCLLALSGVVVGCGTQDPEPPKDAPVAEPSKGAKAGGMLGQNPDAGTVEFGSKK